MVFGTRPEAIKLAPLVREMQRRGAAGVSLCVTGQHRQMLDQALGAFDLRPDFDLDLMTPDQSLSDITSAVLKGIDSVIRETQPSMVVVQGDTTTALAGALAAYYSRAPIAHVEAGLRTGQKYSPFPEEANRTLIDAISDLHFAPTEHARENLLRSGVGGESITVTGNTAIDAVLMTAERVQGLGPDAPGLAAIPRELAGAVTDPGSGRRLVLVTGHRRESFGADLEAICGALLRIAAEHEDVEVAYAVHLNPNVRGPVFRLLGGHERVTLLDPPAYRAFVWLLGRAHLVITDSGGIQEEAPALDKPVLVTRRVTERPEAVEAGCALLAGVDTAEIAGAARQLLTDDELYRRMSAAPNPFGDGHASERIADVIERWLAANG